VRVVLGDHDREVLTLLHTYFRVATARELFPLLAAHFSTRFLLWRRLRQLYDAGYLARPPAQELLGSRLRGGRWDLYALDNRGAAELRTLGREVSRGDHEKADELKPLSLGHLTATSETVAAFLVALRGRPELALAAFFRDGQFHRRIPCFDGRRPVTLPLKPDATFVLEEPARSDRTVYFLEVDRHTMPAHRNELEQSSFRKKVLAYRAYWHDQRLLEHDFATTDAVVLTVAESATRVASLRLSVEREDADGAARGLFWFTTRAEVITTDPLTAAIWTTAAGDRGSLFDPLPT